MRSTRASNTMAADALSAMIEADRLSSTVLLPRF
jgi:hypothetical protein